MSMPLGFATKVSLFSMRKRTIRTVLSLLPCVLLIAIMFVGSTIPNGLVNELDAKVLTKAQDRQEYVVLDSFLFSQPDYSTSSSSGSSMTFNQEKYDLATTSPLVDIVYPQRGSVNGVAGDVGGVKNAVLQMSGTSAEFAKLYTPDEFTYTAGHTIPVLVNPNSIGSLAYNWDGKDTIEIDYSKSMDSESKQTYQTITDPEKLVGSTFKAEFGVFPNLPEAFDEQQFSGFGPPKSKLTKLTDSDRDIINRRLQEIYGTHWDLAKLKTPIVYEFKIVGLLSGQSNAIAMVPNEAVPSIWNALYQRQLSARTATAMNKELLASDTGKVEVVDGFIADSYSFAGVGTIMKDPSVSAWQVDISQISIPGLLVEPTKNSRGQNEYKEIAPTTITEKNFRKSGAVVKLKSSDDREAYVKFLGDSGLYYYDNNPVSVIKGIRNGANIFVTWLTIILGTVVALILLTTVSRFVADSRKEIGVWRAIGAKRLDISKLVLVRMSILLMFGILAGVVIGYGLSALIAKEIVASTNDYSGSINPYSMAGGNFVGSIVLSFLGGEVPKLELAKLLAPDWQLLGSRLGLLAIITLVVGLIPALRASRISPVTAIRDSE